MSRLYQHEIEIVAAPPGSGNSVRIEVWAWILSDVPGLAITQKDDDKEDYAMTHRASGRHILTGFSDVLNAINAMRLVNQTVGADWSLPRANLKAYFDANPVAMDDLDRIGQQHGAKPIKPVEVSHVVTQAQA